jgi:hypothetical protein
MSCLILLQTPYFLIVVLLKLNGMLEYTRQDCVNIIQYTLRKSWQELSEAWSSGQVTVSAVFSITTIIPFESESVRIISRFRSKWPWEVLAYPSTKVRYITHSSPIDLILIEGSSPSSCLTPRVLIDITLQMTPASPTEHECATLGQELGTVLKQRRPFQPSSLVQSVESAHLP